MGQGFPRHRHGYRHSGPIIGFQYQQTVFSRTTFAAGSADLMPFGNLTRAWPSDALLSDGSPVSYTF